jgi:hypothetical protein
MLPFIKMGKTGEEWSREENNAKLEMSSRNSGGSAK